MKKTFTLLIAALLCCVGVVKAQTIVGLTEVPQTAVDLSTTELTTGYYLIKQTNSADDTGFLKAASEAADAVVAANGAPTVNAETEAVYIWYVEVAEDGKFSIATANKVAGWQAPTQKQKNLVAYANKATTLELEKDFSSLNQTTQTLIKAYWEEKSCYSYVHASANKLGSWNDQNTASLFYVEFYAIPENKLIVVDPVVNAAKTALSNEIAAIAPKIGLLPLQTGNAGGTYYLSATQQGDAHISAAIDNKPGTHYGSTWSSEVGAHHYWQVDLGEGVSLSSFVFTYITRENGKDTPTKINVKGSANGQDFSNIVTLTKENNSLPSEGGKTYTSEAISNTYRYIRFEVPSTTTNYSHPGKPEQEVTIAIAEFKLFVGDESSLSETDKMLKKAVDAAQAVLDNQDATVEQLQEALETLQSAALLAEMKPQIDALNALINEVQSLSGSFSEGTKEQIANAVAQGREAAEYGISTERINEATALLNQAKERANKNLAINDWFEKYCGEMTPATPVDATSLVTNPDMESRNIKGWEATSGWQFQNNNVYNGNGAVLRNFQERWVSGGGKLGNTSSTQTLQDMPAGTYRLSADVLATQQNGGSISGASLFMNGSSVNVATGGAPSRYSVEVTAKDGVLTFGVKGENTNANWMAFDNVKLEMLNVYDAKVAASLLVKAMEQFDLLPSKSSLSQLMKIYENAWLPMKKEAQLVLDNIADYQDIKLLDAMTEKVEAVTAYILEICDLYSGKYYQIYTAAKKALANSAPLNATYADAFNEALEVYGPGKVVRFVTSLEELQAMIDGLQTAYLAYATHAEPFEGALFDATFMIENPSFETGDLSGWEATQASDAGVRSNADAKFAMSGCDGQYLFQTSGGSGFSLTQTIMGLPAGVYSLHAVMATDRGVELVMTAGAASATYRFADHKGQGSDKVVTHFEHKGGDLLIKFASNNWFKVDNVRLYCEGNDQVIPELSPVAITPAVRTRIEKLTHLTFTYESLVGANEACTKSIKVKDAKGELLAEASLAQCAFDGNSVTVTFDQAVELQGDITVDVPKGMFTVASMLDDRTFEASDMLIKYGLKVNPVEVDSPWMGSVIENGKTYYLYNAKAQAFMKGANDWGTRASFGQDAVALTAEGSGAQYALKSTLGSYLGSDLYLDQAKCNFVFKEVGVGVYTITLNNQFVGFNNNNVVAVMNDVNDGCYWQLVTAADVRKQMLAAEVRAPYNVTPLIAGANFSRNDNANKAWSGEPTLGGPNVNFCAEKLNAGVVTVSQELTNMPSGTYRLDVQGFYRMGDVANATEARQNGSEELHAKFFANKESIPVMSIMDECGKMNQGAKFGDFGLAPNDKDQASNAFSAGLYEHSFLFTVAEGENTIKLGVTKTGSVENDWVVFDNFRLSYYGTASIAQINKAQFLAVKDELDMLTNTCMSLDMLGAVSNEYMAVSEMAFMLAENDEATTEEVNEFIPVMEAMIAKVKEIDEYYTNVFTPMSDLCYEIMENSIPSTEEAFMEFDEVCAQAGSMTLYTQVESVEDLQELVRILEDGRQAYVLKASPAQDYAFDYTFLVVNPDMSDGAINGWETTAGWNFQQNSAYTNEGAELRKFQERWQSGSGLGDASSTQTLTELPNGIYRISADIIATAQYAANPKEHTNGAYWVANDKEVTVATENNKPEQFTVEAKVVDGVLTFGLVGKATTANWLAFDNVVVMYCGSEALSAPTTGIVNSQNDNNVVIVYSIEGKQIKTTAEGVKNLDKGIYIIDGKKKMVK